MVDQAAQAIATDPFPACTTQRVPVQFEGDRAGIGGLSWGQHELWRVMYLRNDWLPVGKPVPLPPGTTLDDEVASLRFLLSNYPTMRTRLRFDPDRGREQPLQVVADAGETVLEVVDIDDDADPATAADQLWQRTSTRDFDVTADWPVRMALIRHRGRLTHRAWVMCHLVTDGFGAQVYTQEKAAGDASRSRAAPAPLEQARWQASPAGQRQSQVAMRYWERVLRGLSSRRFPEPTERPYPRYREARFTSPALYLATRAIAARTGVELSSVLLGVFATALARTTGINPVVLVLVVNNRFRPGGLARAVCPLIQPGLSAIALPAGTVDEAVKQTWRKAMTTYKHAYHDPIRREELIERLNQERGEADLECAFNDRRIAHREPAGPPPNPDQVRAASGQARFEWTQQRDDRRYDTLYVYVDDVPDTIQLTVNTDVHKISPGNVEACVRGMEEVAVAAALDPAARTGVPVAGGAAE